MVARTKKTPGDELAAVDEQIAKLEKEGEDLSARRGEAEASLRDFPDRREAALRLQKLGEKVELPDEAEQARLQRFVADAKSEEDAVLWARRQREGVRMKVLAAGLPHFDAAGEESARALEAEGEALLAALAAFQAAQQRKNEAWRRSYDGRHELRVDKAPSRRQGEP